MHRRRSDSHLTVGLPAPGKRLHSVYPPQESLPGLRNTTHRITTAIEITRLHGCNEKQGGMGAPLARLEIGLLRTSNAGMRHSMLFPCGLVKLGEISFSFLAISQHLADTSG